MGGRIIPKGNGRPRGRAGAPRREVPVDPVLLAEGASWLDGLFALALDEASRERYYGALSMAEALGLAWERDGEGRHALSPRDPGRVYT